MEGSALDSMISQMTKQDIRLKIKVGDNLLAWLDDESNSLNGEDVGALVDGLVSWLGSSNSKIQQNGLEILTRVVVSQKEDFKPFISSLLPACIDRMGDSKERIRDTNADLLNEIMKVTSPQYILDRLGAAYSHKNSRVREEILLLMQDTIMRYTAQSLALSKFIPSICKLLDDPNAQVRETAMTTLVVIYRYVGDKLRHDLHRKYSIQAGKMQILIERFDRAIEDGEMLVSPNEGPPPSDFDEPDRVVPKPRTLAQPLTTAAKKGLPPTGSGASSKATANGRNRTVPGSGAVDEESFMESFTDVPRINVFSARELEQHFANIKSVIANMDADWEKRLNALKMIRSLVIAGAKDYDEFLPALKTIELPVQNCVKDLRSQIVREACITISYLCVQLNSKMDRFCELLLPSLILLMGATVKVMSSSGVVCTRFIIKHVHSQRLVPVIVQNLSTKNKEIRRHSFEYLNEILILWPTYTLERHIAILQQAIKVGLSDADQEARSYARKAFWAFAEHFKPQADHLLFSLDSSKQKMLHGEYGAGGGAMSNSSSSTSLHNLGRPGSRVGNSTESLKYAQRAPGAFVSKVPYVNSPQRRANSAIDMKAARSSQLKAIAKTPHSGFGYSANEFSLPRALKSNRAESICSAITSPERTPQQSRGRQVSHSQPNSRSASPSSRFSYITHNPGSVSRKSTSRSRIPMPTSRDPSPSRSIGSQSSSSQFSETNHRRNSLSRYNRAGHREVSITPSTPTAAERLLRNSREAEERMAEILGSTGGSVAYQSPVYARQHSFGLRREDSDASSISSDVSGRFEDVPDILNNLGSVHWSDRKDGLTGLVHLLRNQGHALSDPDLQKITQTLTKMFMDPHTKVFALFLDTLNELITVHSNDLHRIGFLSILLTKLFIKSGQDLLGSVVNKISKTMDLIRNSFPHTDQFTVITRFINDPAHSSSTPKVKIQVLNYLEKLTATMNSMDLPGNDPNMRDTFLKITSWTADTKNVELQQRARQVIISLYRVKTSYFSTVINQMAPEFQRIALRTIQGQLQSSIEGRLDSPLRSPSGDNSTRPSIPPKNPTAAAAATSHKSFEAENCENLDVAFEDDSVDAVTKGVAPALNATVNSGKGSASERLNHCIQLLASPMTSTEQKRSAIAEVQILSKESSLWEAETNFNSICRVLLANLSEEPVIRLNILKCLADIYRRHPSHSKKNLDEALRKVIVVYKDKDKDVQRMCDQLVSVVLSSIPPQFVSKTCADIVNGAIAEIADSSQICTAIRIIQSFIDFHKTEVLRENLTTIGPVLTRSYDHTESSVRKASVFALVALHQKAGKDDLYPYLSQLPGCKLRLLNLYISRAASQESGRGDTSPSSCSNASNH